MALRCPSCGQTGQVAVIPGHRGKCRACGEVYDLPRSALAESAAPPPAKHCSACGIDVTHQWRGKSSQGDYFCRACWPTRNGSPEPEEILSCPICAGTFPISQMDLSGVCRNCAVPVVGQLESNGVDEFPQLPQTGEVAEYVPIPSRKLDSDTRLILWLVAGGASVVILFAVGMYVFANQNKAPVVTANIPAAGAPRGNAVPASAIVSRPPSWRSGTAADAIVFFVLISILCSFLAIWVVMAICLGILYRRAGKPAWAVLVPFYDGWVYCEVAGQPGWWSILYFLPFGFIFRIISIVGFTRMFNRGGLFALGLIFMPIVFYPIMVLGKFQHSSQGYSRRRSYGFVPVMPVGTPMPQAY